MQAVKLTENTGKHKAGEVITVTEENLYWCHAMIVRGKAVPYERAEKQDPQPKRPRARTR